MIPKSEVVTHGLPYIHCELSKLSDYEKSKFSIKKYFNYFKRTWIPVVERWNISSIVADGNHRRLLINRTNNALENHNKQCHLLFPNPHPAMDIFITGIKTMLHNFVVDCKEIERSRTKVKRSKHAVAVLHDIPDDYYTNHEIFCHYDV